MASSSPFAERNEASNSPWSPSEGCSPIDDRRRRSSPYTSWFRKNSFGDTGSVPNRKPRGARWKGVRPWSDSSGVVSEESPSSASAVASASLNALGDSAALPTSRESATLTTQTPSFIPRTVREHVQSGGYAFALLLLAEDEFIRALRRIEYMGMELVGDEDTPLLVFPFINAYMRMCIHETARRFRLATRSVDVGDERCLHVYRTPGTSIPLVRYADLLMPSLGPSRAVHFETFCSSSVPLFECGPGLDYHVCIICLDPMVPTDLDTVAASTAGSTPLLPLTYDWAFVDQDRRDHISPLRTNSGSTPPIRCTINHLLVVYNLPTPASTPADELADALICSVGWAVAASSGSSLATAVRTELFRRVPADSTAAVLVCPSVEAATAALPKLQALGHDAELFENASTDFLATAGFSGADIATRGRRDVSTARRIIQRSLRPKW